jgi:cytoskeletal protein RodZ
MKQTSQKKVGAWGSRLLIAAALLATVFAGLLASPPATAQSVPPVQTVPAQPGTDPGTGCGWGADNPGCIVDSALPTASSPPASPTATASPTPTATSTTPPAAKNQYTVPDTAADSSTATASPTASATTSPTASATTSPGTQLPPSGGYSLGLVAALALVAFGAVALVLVLVRRAAS